MGDVDYILTILNFFACRVLSQYVKSFGENDYMLTILLSYVSQNLYFQKFQFAVTLSFFLRMAHAYLQHIIDICAVSFIALICGMRCLYKQI